MPESEPARPAPEEQIDATRGAELVIAISGDVDIVTAPRIERRMVELIAADGVEDVVIDLSRVGFFDSAGVRVLVVAKQEASVRHLPLHVQEPSAQCRRVLEVSGLEELLGLR